MANGAEQRVRQGRSAHNTHSSLVEHADGYPEDPNVQALPPLLCLRFHWESVQLSQDGR